MNTEQQPENNARSPLFGLGSSEGLGLGDRLRQRGCALISHPVANGTIECAEAAGELMIEAAAEIERLHTLLREPTRGHVFAGWFSELRSGMAYRLWEQGGYEPGPDEVPLYV